MNLIANTGIQFYTSVLEIDERNDFKMFFQECFDQDKEVLELKIAHKFTQDDVWVDKEHLFELGYLKNGEAVEEVNGELRPIKWEDVKEDFLSEHKPLNHSIGVDDGSEFFRESISNLNWHKYEHKWLPLPYFKLDARGRTRQEPNNWCRFKLIPLGKEDNIRKYQMLIMFDTKVVYDSEEDGDFKEYPVFGDFDSSVDFKVCNNEFQLLEYCSENTGHKWVDSFLLKNFHNVDSINQIKNQTIYKKYIAEYICLINYISKINLLPLVTLFRDKNEVHSNVDLVVDIGNSRTCAVLFDEGDFDKLSPLELFDFNQPVSNSGLNLYKDPFGMRMAFRKADLGGNMGIATSNQFTYPSIVRLGHESNRLIKEAVNLNTGAEKTSTFSSPKRYLWDIRKQNSEWEFVKLPNEVEESFYIKGISEQFNEDGSLNISGTGGDLMKYSRKSLMTFAFIEILAQATMQINSYEQRKHWGNESQPRQIRKIIITCPTAMSKIEQLALRECAQDAAIILKRFYNPSYFNELDEKEVRREIQVIPSVENLKKMEEKIEWIYDEATATQFVYLYAEIGERYLGKANEFFDFYGKNRLNFRGEEEKSLIIGSVDIGGGTTDVMIASYKVKESESNTLKPTPIFWESFYQAGDDLLKEMVYRLVVEGEFSPIESKLKKSIRTPNEIATLKNNFFGGNTGMSFRNRQLRRDFNLQIAVPIVSKYLDLLSKQEPDKVLSFNEIFENNYPSVTLLNYFKNHFGFDIESLQWEYNKEVISIIIEQTFDTLVGKVSTLFAHFDCDVVLLSGRPSSLKPLTDLFLKYYAISPNRLKTMHDYRVGNWYPEDKRYSFTDGNGYFINPKSIVVTGAMIANLASQRNLEGMSLDLTDLIEKLTPTTEYFGLINRDVFEIKKPFISPENNKAKITVPYLPIKIGSQQIDTKAYPVRSFYRLDYNIDKLRDRVMRRIPKDYRQDPNRVEREVEKEINKIQNSFPLKVEVNREYKEDKEKLNIQLVTGSDGMDWSLHFFDLIVQSLDEMEDYWLDTGIFKLNIN